MTESAVATASQYVVLGVIIGLIVMVIFISLAELLRRKQ
jgi:hypothetical protein